MSNLDRSEMHKYTGDWDMYAMGISERPDKSFRFALGSFIEDYSNKVEIVKLDADSCKFEKKAVFDHPYPATKIMWIPDHNGYLPDLIATTGDYLRVWSVNTSDEGQVSVGLRQFFNNSKNSEFCAPLTSFDWNDQDANMIGTASIDTTCTIWDLNTGQAKTQLIAHDKEVYDIAFASRTVFGSVGAEGSLRLFDLRSLEHSTIIFETSSTPKATPLLRLAWNKMDTNYIAAVPLDSHKVIIVDIRVPTIPVTILEAHDSGINAVVWAPHSGSHLSTGADDKSAYIWDLADQGEKDDTGHKCIYNPILAYNAPAPINSLNWSRAHTDWVAITMGDKLEVLRV